LSQIGKEVKRFAKAVGLTCTCIYGGSGVASQISELKRGTEIVVCTPGRMIDILGEPRSGAGVRLRGCMPAWAHVPCLWLMLAASCAWPWPAWESLAHSSPMV
jgi:hypothetical protein